MIRCPRAALGQEGGRPPRRVGAHGGTVDDGGAAREPGRHALDHRAHVGIGRDADHGHVEEAGELFEGGRRGDA